MSDNKNIPTRFKYYSYKHPDYATLLGPGDRRREIDPFVTGGKIGKPPATTSSVSGYTKNASAL